MKTFVTAGAALLVAASPARAGGFADNFDAEGGGATIINYTGFANFDVLSGSVDLLHVPNIYGLSCYGGTGGCVDLDGSSGQSGTLRTKNAYAVNVGDRVTLDFLLSGNTRNAGSDYVFVGFAFPTNTLLFDYSESGGFGNTNFGTFYTATITSSTIIASDSPFTPYRLSFRAGGAGPLMAYIGALDTDNQGAILDNFALSITAAPEPETWALMIPGLGVVGAAMRRRRVAESYRDARVRLRGAA